MSQIGPELLGRLLDEHGAALRLYARQWCRTPDDVLQEALLQLVRQPAAPEQIVPWLYKVVRNGALIAARSAERRLRHEAQAVQTAVAWFDPATDHALDAQAATAVLSELPLEQREAIVARLWGGLSFEEIAAVTETSSSTAHRRYEAGLAALRERLGAACRKTSPS